jgi:putative SOS response-associated peptidase YedK
LNARIETIESLPSFKDTISNRCLIPASRFYDWRHEGKTKIPYLILSNENEIFSFAGLYSDWMHPETKATLRTCTMLTTQANQTMQYIHNTKQRMPVILHQEDEENWLHGDAISKYAFPYNTSLVGFKMN